MSDYFCQWCYDRGLRYPDNARAGGAESDMKLCPVCKTMKPLSHFACHSGKLGGKKGGKSTGQSKARTTEQARAAARARWTKPEEPE